MLTKSSCIVIDTSTERGTKPYSTFVLALTYGSLYQTFMP